ncbi:hypothetical protein GCM10023219_07630 [Stakelama sediminis]|uniref:Intracellular sulfur oxidation DsrE/DsrF family protein n=1 Tax=Stakelama sediminis TaxID=463200 RepID=A0A840YVC3_9SPHN|nr:DsrE family protein [Stakelama sediminis]MBB5717484.1 intracellular sulfur oxidation DsrE/DsrF family protein [Stakelama sediminis]
MRIFLTALAVSLLGATPAMAQMSKFHPGPVFSDFGKIAPVESDLPIPKDSVFKLLFDSNAASDPATLNRIIDRAARFINMQVEAGVPEANIHVAIVLHGPAAYDVTKDDFYRTRHDGKPNLNVHAVSELIAHGVQIYVCGQSATAMDIGKDKLLPGVKMALSAMTADALLQQQGYTLIPS